MARLRLSWRAPWWKAPSPKKQSVTPPSPSVGLGEGDAGRHRDLRAHDAVAAEHALGGIEEVHRAALAPRDAGSLAEELGHDRAWVHAEGQGVAMVPVAGEHVVPLEVEDGDRPDRHRLLARSRDGRSRRSCAGRTSCRPSPRSCGSAACVSSSAPSLSSMARLRSVAASTAAELGRARESLAASRQEKRGRHDLGLDDPERRRVLGEAPEDDEIGSDGLEHLGGECGILDEPSLAPEGDDLGEVGGLEYPFHAIGSASISAALGKPRAVTA